MSKQNLSTLSDIPEERSASVSVDSLENADEINDEISKGDGAAGGLNCTQTSNVDLPSFHNILSSSHCDASPSPKPGTACTVETSQHFTVAALFIKENAPERLQKSSADHGYVGISEKDTTEARECANIVGPVQDPASSITTKDKCASKIPTKTASKSEPRRTSETRGELHSRIPVAVRSSPAIAGLRQSVEKHGHADDAPRAVPEVEVSSSPSQIAAAAPKAAERCRSHHTIERPRKDFIQLNKQGEFRRTRTYHTLHLERRDGQKTADGTAFPPTTSSTTAATGAARPDISIAGADKGDTSPAEFTQPSHDPSEPSVRAPGPGSSPRGSDPSSPAAGSEGSSGRRSSRIPVRTGPPTTPRRRHQSHESPRSHVSPRHEGHEEHVSRQDRHVSRRELNESRFEFHESRLSYDSSESELVVPKLHQPHSQLSLIDVNDNRRLLSEVSAPSLLDHQYQGHGRNRDLIILGDNMSSLSLQLAGPRKVYTPPDRAPMPYRHVEYQPNLKPYPRQYINLGRLGPDPDTVRARQEKAQKQQAYADRVAKKNRSVVKQKSHHYSKQQQEAQAQSSYDKMVSYAKTVPKPKQKPKPQSTTSPKASHEVSPMSKIRILLAGSDPPSNNPPSKKSPRSKGASPTRPCVSSTSQPGKSIPPSEIMTSAKPPPAGRPAMGRQQSVSVPEPRPPPLPLPTFEAPKTAALPPTDTRRRPRRQPGRSASVGQARVANSLSRLRSLTDQLVTGPPVTPSTDDATRLRRDDSCPTLGASSDIDSEYSTDSLIGASRPTVVSTGRSHGSTSPRGRGMFPPARGAPSCRRPTTRCSRGVGPDRPGAASRPVAEDFFYDTCGGLGECACGDNSCSPPLSPHRRPAVTRGTQSTPTLNETFVVRKNPLVVDIGLPVGADRARRSSPRPRLGELSPDSLAGSPPSVRRTGWPDGPPSHAAALQMMRERHLRDKRRVDAIISGSVTRM